MHAHAHLPVHQLLCVRTGLRFPTCTLQPHYVHAPMSGAMRHVPTCTRLSPPHARACRLGPQESVQAAQEAAVQQQKPVYLLGQDLQAHGEAATAPLPSPSMLDRGWMPCKAPKVLMHGLDSSRGAKSAGACGVSCALKLMHTTEFYLSKGVLLSLHQSLSSSNWKLKAWSVRHGYSTCMPHLQSQADLGSLPFIVMEVVHCLRSFPFPFFQADSCCAIGCARLTAAVPDRASQCNALPRKPTRLTTAVL
eukprot:717583-Pelagomonas_calceolata.AAC.2